MYGFHAWSGDGHYPTFYQESRPLVREEKKLLVFAQGKKGHRGELGADCVEGSLRGGEYCGSVGTITDPADSYYIQPCILICFLSLWTFLDPYRVYSTDTIYIQ